MSYSEFQSYIDGAHPGREGWVTGDMQEQMRAALKDAVEAVAGRINPKRRRNCFELVGCDFMVSEDFRLVLIEVHDAMLHFFNFT